MGNTCSKTTIGSGTPPPFRSTPIFDRTTPTLSRQISSRSTPLSDRSTTTLARLTPSRSTKTLHIFLVHFNPAGFNRPVALYVDTIKRLVKHKQALEQHIASTMSMSIESTVISKKRGVETAPTTPLFRNVRLSINAIELVYSKKRGCRRHTTPPYKPPLQTASIIPSTLKPFINHRMFVTDPVNVFWSKENLLNIAISEQIQTNPDMNYIAWIDGDIIFESPSWVEDTILALDKLGQPGGHVQMFSSATLEGPPSTSTTTSTAKPNDLLTVRGFGYQHSFKKIYSDVDNSHPEYWHPGFAWACNRAAYLTTNGLLQRTLGSADRHMAMAIIGMIEKSYPEQISADYKQYVDQWAQKCRVAQLKLGYTPGHIRHQWHGPLSGRQYVSRWDILIKHNFSPVLDLQTRSDGLLIWTSHASKVMLHQIVEYFKQRNEDSIIPEPRGAPPPFRTPGNGRGAPPPFRTPANGGGDRGALPPFRTPANGRGAPPPFRTPANGGRDRVTSTVDRAPIYGSSVLLEQLAINLQYQPQIEQDLNHYHHCNPQHHDQTSHHHHQSCDSYNHHSSGWSYA